MLFYSPLKVKICIIQVCVWYMCRSVCMHTWCASRQLCRVSSCLPPLQQVPEIKLRLPVLCASTSVCWAFSLAQPCNLFGNETDYALKYIHLKISSMTSVFIRLKLKCGFIRGASGFPSVRLVLEFWHCCSTVSYGTWVLELWPGWQGNEERTVTLRKNRHMGRKSWVRWVVCSLDPQHRERGLRRQFPGGSCSC